MDEGLIFENLVSAEYIGAMQEKISNELFSNNISFSSLEYNETVLPTELECCYNEFKYYQKKK